MFEFKERIENALKKYFKNKILYISEPCNCGGQIRHNNGGNYHGLITICRDEGKDWVSYGSTSEFTDWTDWEICNDVEKIITDHREWL